MSAGARSPVCMAVLHVIARALFFLLADTLCSITQMGSAYGGSARYAVETYGAKVSCVDISTRVSVLPYHSSILVPSLLSISRHHAAHVRSFLLHCRVKSCNHSKS